MCLALTNALISDLIPGRHRRNLYYLAVVLDMVLAWTNSRLGPLSYSVVLSSRVEAPLRLH